MHRNVANVVVHTDLNCLSVLQYAVEVLKVEHIIVCGHYQCGGVLAALNDSRFGLIDNWLRHIQDVRDRHRALLDTIAEDARHDALVELNVIRQVRNVTSDVFVQEAWARGQPLSVHGWVYSLANGLVTDLSEPGQCLDLALQWAQRLNERAPNALASIKELAQSAPTQVLTDQMAQEKTLFVKNLHHPNAWVGIQAFLDKTQPTYKP